MGEEGDWLQLDAEITITEQPRIISSSRVNSTLYPGKEVVAFNVRYPADGTREDLEEDEVRPLLQTAHLREFQETCDALVGVFDYLEHRMTGVCNDIYDCEDMYETCRLFQAFDPSFAANLTNEWIDNLFKISMFGMVWTKAQVDEIAEELLATDIPYDLNALQGYDEDGLRAFFENGGSDEAPPEPTLSSSSGCWGPLPEEVKWKVNANGTVAVITMNRPAENNAMDDNLIAGLVMCVKRVQESPDLRVCFLTGAGKMFCAGGDPKAFQKAAALAKEAEAKGVLGTADDQNVSGAMTFAQMLQA
ncbi:hypothetical protein AB1Y20_014266 [Prymnesium parvum]